MDFNGGICLEGLIVGAPLELKVVRHVGSYRVLFCPSLSPHQSSPSPCNFSADLSAKEAIQQRWERRMRASIPHAGPIASMASSSLPTVSSEQDELGSHEQRKLLYPESQTISPSRSILKLQLLL